MDLIVSSDGVAIWDGRRMRCALGPAGIRRDKREGDGATPAGSWTMRRAYYRPDRLAPPLTKLGLVPLLPGDGWCDAPDDPAYNRPIRLPYPASAEDLWRSDGLYDLFVALGYNDDPVVPGRGSAIFLHIAAPGFTPTAGCVALAREDLLAVVGAADLASRVIVAAPPAD